MPVMRLIVTVAFAWVLVRAAFANTVAWRHSQSLVSAMAHYAPVSKALDSQRVVSENGT